MKPAQTPTPLTKPAPAKPPLSGEGTAYLRRLGERVRTLRNQRGMSRKVLAKQAKVSERYIAQLEAGLGNCSIVLLRRIARAIGLPVTQLVHEGPEPTLDLVLLTQFLERLSPPELAQARGLLSRNFSPPSEDTRRKRIALIGLRGGGKSTLGALLAERLDVPFIELDREIERRSGASLSEIFDAAPNARRSTTCCVSTSISSSPPAAQSSPSPAPLKSCCRPASRCGCAPNRRIT
jgi:XRE family aerobic/anaerobic benzoate catabolism transcriptional regulator